MQDSEPQFEPGGTAGNRLFEDGVTRLNERDFAGAIEAFRLALQQGTDFPAPAHAYGGCAWLELKQYRRAVAELSRAIAIDPQGQALDDRAFYRRRRGHALTLSFRYRAALRDFEWIVARCTPLAQDFAAVGFLHRLYGKYGESIAACEAALNLAPAHVDARTNLAYLLATCPKSRFRDGAKSLVIASALNEESRHESWIHLSVLAAAYAEVGDFERAVHFARLCAACSPEGSDRERLRRIRQYERGRPYRSRPWRERYRYRLQVKWLAMQQQRRHGESSDT
jgi:tetratricopeptide (TPR) repeat protein